jgi:hypothetical protein
VEVYVQLYLAHPLAIIIICRDGEQLFLQALANLQLIYHREISLSTSVNPPMKLAAFQQFSWWENCSRTACSPGELLDFRLNTLGIYNTSARKCVNSVHFAPKYKQHNCSERSNCSLSAHFLGKGSLFKK